MCLVPGGGGTGAERASRGGAESAVSDWRLLYAVSGGPGGVPAGVSKVPTQLLSHGSCQQVAARIKERTTDLEQAIPKLSVLRLESQQELHLGLCSKSRREVRLVRSGAVGSRAGPQASPDPAEGYRRVVGLSLALCRPPDARLSTPSVNWQWLPCAIRSAFHFQQAGRWPAAESLPLSFLGNAHARQARGWGLGSKVRQPRHLKKLTRSLQL